MLCPTFNSRFVPISSLRNVARRQKPRILAIASKLGPHRAALSSSNASARRSNGFPFRPNGVTIKHQGTKAAVKTLEIETVARR
jgi:hypothetical protein